MAKTTPKGSVAPKTVTATIHDQKMQRGEGGELHQIAEGDTPSLSAARRKLRSVATATNAVSSANSAPFIFMSPIQQHMRIIGD